MRHKHSCITNNASRTRTPPVPLTSDKKHRGDRPCAPALTFLGVGHTLVCGCHTHSYFFPIWKCPSHSTNLLECSTNIGQTIIWLFLCVSGLLIIKVRCSTIPQEPQISQECLCSNEYCGLSPKPDSPLLPRVLSDLSSLWTI